MNAAKYSDSPHLTIPGESAAAKVESGGGAAAAGADARFPDLQPGPEVDLPLVAARPPNVINAHDPADLQVALCWLGEELKRRAQAAYYSAGGTGRVRGSVGARIVVPGRRTQLRHAGTESPLDDEILAQEQEPAEEVPGVAALSALACAGRASDIHMWLVGQLLTVKSTGVKDSTIRTNAGIKAIAARTGRGGRWRSASTSRCRPRDLPGRIQRSDRR